MKAAILAGGKGTRLGKLAENVPKPMVMIGGKPLLEHQIGLLTRYGFDDIILCTGHLSNIIEEYLGDGRRFKARIRYSAEDKPLGSAGCLKPVEKILGGQFLLLNGDVMLDMDLGRLKRFHGKKKADATLTCHPNDHPHDSDLIEADACGRIIAFHPKPREEGGYYRNLVNAGAQILSKSVFDYIEEGAKAELWSEVLPKMLKDGCRLYAYNTPEYLKDMGTPHRLEEVERDYASGLIASHNLDRRRPAVFLDRDGVINREKHLLHRVEDFELLPGSSQAIKAINRSKYLCIVVTNQPVVARGLCSIEDVEKIHNKMETLLGRDGAKLDAIYYCPHHPDAGYPGENPKFKVKCKCRKPGTGMIDEAVKDYNIDLKGSYVIGDSTIDVQLGKNAGVKTIGVATGYACSDAKYSVKPDRIYKDLKEAVEAILGGKAA